MTQIRMPESMDLMAVWKVQADTAARMLDAVVQANAKVRAAQLAAANEAHERTQALERLLVQAKTPGELWNAQWSWALANCECYGTYWRSMMEAMNEAGSEVARCAREGAAARPAAE